MKAIVKKVGDRDAIVLTPESVEEKKALAGLPGTQVFRGPVENGQVPMSQWWVNFTDCLHSDGWAISAPEASEAVAAQRLGLVQLQDAGDDLLCRPTALGLAVRAAFTAARGAIG